MLYQFQPSSTETMAPKSSYRLIHLARLLMLGVIISCLDWTKTSSIISLSECMDMSQSKDTDSPYYDNSILWMFSDSLLRPFGSCHVTELSSETSSLDQLMWGWIKNARFSGVKQFRQQKVNMWTYTVSH